MFKLIRVQPKPEYQAKMKVMFNTDAFIVLESQENDHPVLEALQKVIDEGYNIVTIIPWYGYFDVVVYREEDVPETMKGKRILRLGEKVPGWPPKKSFREGRENAN